MSVVSRRSWRVLPSISTHAPVACALATGACVDILLSVVNLKLRDFYPSLDALCDDMDADKDALCKALSAVGYAYDAARNQFI